MYSYVFNNPSHKEDWIEYKRTNIDWVELGMQAIDESNNDVIVVDLPKEQTSKYPEPYFTVIDINNVIDYYEDEGLQWIYYKGAEDKKFFICDEYYRIFGEEDELEEEIEHGRGVCPARFMWDDKNHIGVRKSPITNELTNLDRYVFYDILNQHLNTYARFPVYWGYERQCDYSDQKGKCDRGFLRNVRNDFILERDGSLMKCPVCAEKRLGAGAFVEVPEPEDGVDMRDPIGIVKIDKDSLVYNADEVKKLEQKIYARVTGKGSTLVEEYAVNQDQIYAIHEGELTALMNVKRNIESLIQWTESMICGFRYDSFVECHINLGTEFYLFTYPELSEIYGSMIDQHHDSVMLDAVQDEMHVTKYKNNPDKLERARLIKHVIPFRHITKADAAEMRKDGDMSLEDFYMVCNQSSYLMRFERENGELIKFGVNLDFKNRIEKIQKVLYGYAKETASKGEAQET